MELLLAYVGALCLVVVGVVMVRDRTSLGPRASRADGTVVAMVGVAILAVLVL